MIPYTRITIRFNASRATLIDTPRVVLTPRKTHIHLCIIYTSLHTKCLSTAAVPNVIAQSMKYIYTSVLSKQMNRMTEESIVIYFALCLT